jgi:hypothetical protein
VPTLRIDGEREGGRLRTVHHRSLPMDIVSRSKKSKILMSFSYARFINMCYGRLGWLLFTLFC